MKQLLLFGLVFYLLAFGNAGRGLASSSTHPTPSSTRNTGKPLSSESLPLELFGFRPEQKDSKLKEQIARLSSALNRRNLEEIKAQIGANRIYVEIADKAGAYLSSNQALVVMESFLRSRSAVTSNFEFVSENGSNGSASGSLTAQKEGRIVSYKMNFGFTKATSSA